MNSQRQSKQHMARMGASVRLQRVVLQDHVRLPWRFFGRLTAAVQAGL